MKKNRIYIIVALIIAVCGCKDVLQEDVYTQYKPDQLLKTEDGINSTLVSAYGALQNTRLTGGDLAVYELPTDELWDWGGGFINKATALINYTWDPQTSFFKDSYSAYYSSIRNSNALLDNIDNINTLSADKINALKAEAKFIRALDYYYLWDLFGPVPLIKSSTDLDLSPSRPSEEEFSNFLEMEFKSATQDLPLQNEVGKATKGAALAFLGRFYLDKHKWQKAADVNKQVIDLNQYSLYQGDVANMFAVKNEDALLKEVIFNKPSQTNAKQINFQAYNYPPKYPVKPNQSNYGTQFTMYNDFVRTYRSDDKRRGWFLFEYTDIDGVHHNLLDPNDLGRGVRCFKFKPDPNALGAANGNDFPFIRYAEVLLNRSEALNELEGPNQESIDLINKIRQRAGIPSYQLSDFATKERFRDAILKERGHEFVYEALRRRDLIRQDKLIEYARARGATNAQDYMTRYPIPQNEVDINPNIEQNPGY